MFTALWNWANCLLYTWDIGTCDVTDELGVLTDAAFLAREKARADAEFYTAERLAEANRVIN